MSELDQDKKPISKFRLIAVPLVKLALLVLAWIGVYNALFAYSPAHYVDWFHGPLAIVMMVVQTAVIVYVDIVIIAILESVGWIYDENRESVVNGIIVATLALIILAIFIGTIAGVCGDNGGYFRRGIQ